MTEALSILTGPMESDEDYSLTVLRTQNSVLMGRKTRGYGMGKLVLPGGKNRWYLGETGMGFMPFADEAAREAREETGIRISTQELQQKGILHVIGEEESKVVRIYDALVEPNLATVSGELADQAWLPATELPYQEMPQDYPLWLPHVLAGYAVTAFLQTEQDELVHATVYRQQLQPLGRAEPVTTHI